MDPGGANDSNSLERLRTHLESAQRIAGLGSWEVELPSGEVRWSASLDRVLGWPRGEDGGFERLLAVVHPDDRALVARCHATAVREGEPYAVDHRIVRGERIRHVHHEVVVEHDGDVPVALIGTIEDVTERMQLARRLVDTESRRRELLHRLVQASAVARGQLAADLHDGPVQVVTATAMRLEVLARTTDDPPPWLHEAVATIREVSAQLRDVLFELHPQALGGGLEDALAHVASTVLPGTPVSVAVHGGEPGGSVGRAVHGVVQEALWDVREHASADEVAVDVAVRDSVSVVVDGGPGPRPLVTRAGLLGVRERCEAGGGTAELDQGGRVLRCTLPASDDADRASW